MTRDELLAEIRRVAAEAGVRPQNLPRGDFVARSPVGYGHQSFGAWTDLRLAAAMQAGEPASVAAPAPQQANRQEIAYARKLERRLGNVEHFTSRLENALARAMELAPIVPARVLKPAALRKAAPVNCEIVPVLSDLHFGTSTDPIESLGSAFNVDLARRRLARCAEQAASYKTHKRDRTRLRILLNGDLFEGVIHLHDHRIDPLALQIDDTTRALVGMIDFARGHFREIEIDCQGGNHERDPVRGPGRLLAQRWDSHAYTVFLALSMAYRGCDDVRINVHRGPFAHWLTPGGRVGIAAHGDAFPSVPNPARKFEPDKVAQTLRTIDAARVLPDKIAAAVFGHYHSASCSVCSSGATVVVNGCLCGSGQYATNGIGELNAEPVQVMFESDERHAVGDNRFIFVREGDADAGMDEVIPRWESPLRQAWP